MAPPGWPRSAEQDLVRRVVRPIRRVGPFPGPDAPRVKPLYQTPERGDEAALRPRGRIVGTPRRQEQDWSLLNMGLGGEACTADNQGRARGEASRSTAESRDPPPARQ